MTEAQKSGWLGKILRWVVPLLFSGIALWLVLREIEISQLVDNLSRIGWKPLLLATLVYFLSFILRVFCWYILLRRKVSFKDAFFTMGAGYLLNNIFPFRLGEVGRALLLVDPDRSSALEVFSSVVVERVFDVFLAAVFVLAMLPRIIGGDFNQQLILIALILAAVGLVVLYLMARFRDRILQWLTNWGARSKFIRQWLTPKAAQLLEGLSVLENPGSFLLAFGSLALSWGLAFLENYIIFNSLYPNPPFWWLIFVLSAAAFGGALPSAPASIGIFEGVMVAAFAQLGVNAELAFTHAIVVHAFSFVYASAFGLIGLRMRGQAVIDLYQRAVHRNPERDTPE